MVVVVASFLMFPQRPEERPTFESLQWRLEDFFVNPDAGYTEAANVFK